MGRVTFAKVPLPIPLSSKSLNILGMILIFASYRKQDKNLKSNSMFKFFEEGFGEKLFAKSFSPINHYFFNAASLFITSFSPLPK